MPKYSDRIVGEHVAYMRAAGLSVTTIYYRKRTLGRLNVFLDKSLLRATPEDLAAWVKTLDMLPESAATYISNVRSFYAWAVDHGKLRTNPARFLPMPKKGRRLPRPISEADLARAIEAADRRIRLMLVLTACAGLRSAEIAGLRWRFIYLEVDKPFMIVRGKGNRERTIPLSPFLVAELDRYGRRPRGYLFPRIDGQPGPNNPWRISQLIGEHYRSLGILATAHNGRHRFATVALDTCHDVRIVQELLGHASLSTTQIYTKVNPQVAAATVASMPVPIGERNAILRWCDGRSGLGMDLRGDRRARRDSSWHGARCQLEPGSAPASRWRLSSAMCSRWCRAILRCRCMSAGVAQSAEAIRLPTTIPLGQANNVARKWITGASYAGRRRVSQYRWCWRVCASRDQRRCS